VSVAWHSRLTSRNRPTPIFPAELVAGGASGSTRSAGKWARHRCLCNVPPAVPPAGIEPATNRLEGGLGGSTDISVCPQRLRVCRFWPAKRRQFLYELQPRLQPVSTRRCEPWRRRRWCSCAAAGIWSRTSASPWVLLRVAHVMELAAAGDVANWHQSDFQAEPRVRKRR